MTRRTKEVILDILFACALGVMLGTLIALGI